MILVHGAAPRRSIFVFHRIEESGREAIPVVDRRLENISEY
jgi:hypothetical protein